VGPARSEADPDARRALLERVAIATGERWADGWRESLRRQGRRASGGWPGTVTEARALVAAHFTAERHGPALTYDELECAARISYASARHRWLMGEVAEP
jgi:hypothetical protein